MSEERKIAAAPPPPPGAPPASAGDEGMGARCECFERVEFWRGINGVRRSIEEEGANTRAFLGWLVLTFGLVAVIFGFCVMVAPGRRGDERS
jgi:hypothetical protein